MFDTFGITSSGTDNNIKLLFRMTVIQKNTQLIFTLKDRKLAET